MSTKKSPSEEPAAKADSWTVGEPAPHDLYMAYGYLVEVEDIDGSMVEIERLYPEPKVVTELEQGERGNLIVGTDTEVAHDHVSHVAKLGL